MEQERKRATNYTPLTKTVKETIDFVYDYLSPFKDGCEFSAKDTGNQGRVVVRTLLRRGIISMKKMHNGKAHYTWVADMAPTKVLYQSIAAEIRDAQRETQKKYHASKAVAKTNEQTEEKAEATATVETETVRIPEAKLTLNPFGAFSSQDLWDELKARGYIIEDNRLVVVKKAYLD